LGYPANARYSIYRISETDGRYLAILSEMNDKTLESLGVAEEDHFVIDLGMQRSLAGHDRRPSINVEFPGGGSMYILVEPTDTITQVKIHAYRHSGIPVERMTLTFEGVPLDANKTLNECGIETRVFQKGNTLQVVVDDKTVMTPEEKMAAYKNFKRSRDERRRLKLEEYETWTHERGEAFAVMYQGSPINFDEEIHINESELASAVARTIREGVSTVIRISSPGNVYPVLELKVAEGSHEMTIGHRHNEAMNDSVFMVIPSAVGLPEPDIVPLGTTTNGIEAMTMIRRHFGLIKPRNVVEGSENALSYEDIAEGNLMVNFPRTASKNGTGRRTEYNFGTYYKYSPAIRALRQNPETRHPLTPDVFKEYIAHLVPKKAGGKKTRRTRRTRRTHKRRS